MFRHPILARSLARGSKFVKVRNGHQPGSIGPNARDHRRQKCCFANQSGAETLQIGSARNSSNLLSEVSDQGGAALLQRNGRNPTLGGLRLRKLSIGKGAITCNDREGFKDFPGVERATWFTWV
jgi:hypothetical protein